MRATLTRLPDELRIVSRVFAKFDSVRTFDPNCGTLAIFRSNITTRVSSAHSSCIEVSSNSSDPQPLRSRVQAPASSLASGLSARSQLIKRPPEVLGGGSIAGGCAIGRPKVIDRSSQQERPYNSRLLYDALFPRQRRTRRRRRSREGGATTPPSSSPRMHPPVPPSSTPGQPFPTRLPAFAVQTPNDSEWTPRPPSANRVWNLYCDAHERDKFEYFLLPCTSGPKLPKD